MHDRNVRLAVLAADIGFAGEVARVDAAREARAGVSASPDSYLATLAPSSALSITASTAARQAPAQGDSRVAMLNANVPATEGCR
jgi:hypothetical protein